MLNLVKHVTARIVKCQEGRNMVISGCDNPPDDRISILDTKLACHFNVESQHSMYVGRIGSIGATICLACDP